MNLPCNGPGHRPWLCPAQEPMGIKKLDVQYLVIHSTKLTQNSQKSMYM